MAVGHRLRRAGSCLALLVAMVGCGSDDAVMDAVARDAGPAAGGGGEGTSNPTADRRGPLVGGAIPSCVEEYSPSAVRGRAFAFDGVVVSVGPPVSDTGEYADMGLPGVTFDVREWFVGGSGDTVTVDLQVDPGDLADAAHRDYSYGIGSRLLISGESRSAGAPLQSPIAWICGFSRYYDASTAAAWRLATAP